MVWKVLTPPPGFHNLRRVQVELARKGRLQALALPPLWILGDQTAELSPPIRTGRWVRTPCGWGVGTKDSLQKLPFGALAPYPAWLLLPWDWEALPPALEVPQLPYRKLRWALIEIQPHPAGLRWRWIDGGPYLPLGQRRPVGL